MTNSKKNKGRIQSGHNLLSRILSVLIVLGMLPGAFAMTMVAAYASEVDETETSETPEDPGEEEPGDEEDGEPDEEDPEGEPGDEEEDPEGEPGDPVDPTEGEEAGEGFMGFGAASAALPSDSLEGVLADIWSAYWEDLAKGSDSSLLADAILINEEVEDADELADKLAGDDEITTAYDDAEEDAEKAVEKALNEYFAYVSTMSATLKTWQDVGVTLNEDTLAKLNTLLSLDAPYDSWAAVLAGEFDEDGAAAVKVALGQIKSDSEAYKLPDGWEYTDLFTDKVTEILASENELTPAGATASARLESVLTALLQKELKAIDSGKTLDGKRAAVTTLLEAAVTAADAHFKALTMPAFWDSMSDDEKAAVAAELKLDVADVLVALRGAEISEVEIKVAIADTYAAAVNASYATLTDYQKLVVDSKLGGTTIDELAAKAKTAAGAPAGGMTLFSGDAFETAMAALGAVNQIIAEAEGLTAETFLAHPSNFDKILGRDIDLEDVYDILTVLKDATKLEDIKDDQIKTLVDALVVSYDFADGTETNKVEIAKKTLLRIYSKLMNEGDDEEAAIMAAGFAVKNYDYDLDEMLEEIGNTVNWDIEHAKGKINLNPGSGEHEVNKMLNVTKLRWAESFNKGDDIPFYGIATLEDLKGLLFFNKWDLIKVALGTATDLSGDSITLSMQHTITTSDNVNVGEHYIRLTIPQLKDEDENVLTGALEIYKGKDFYTQLKGLYHGDADAPALEAPLSGESLMSGPDDDGNYYVWAKLEGTAAAGLGGYISFTLDNYSTTGITPDGTTETVTADVFVYQFGQWTKSDHKNSSDVTGGITILTDKFEWDAVTPTVKKSHTDKLKHDQTIATPDITVSYATSSLKVGQLGMSFAGAATVTDTFDIPRLDDTDPSSPLLLLIEATSENEDISRYFVFGNAKSRAIATKVEGGYVTQFEVIMFAENTSANSELDMAGQLWFKLKAQNTDTNPTDGYLINYAAIENSYEPVANNNYHREYTINLKSIYKAAEDKIGVATPLVKVVGEYGEVTEQDLVFELIAATNIVIERTFENPNGNLNQGIKKSVVTIDGRKENANRPGIFEGSDEEFGAEADEDVVFELSGFKNVLTKGTMTDFTLIDSAQIPADTAGQNGYNPNHMTPIKIQPGTYTATNAAELSGKKYEIVVTYATSTDKYTNAPTQTTQVPYEVDFADAGFTLNLTLTTGQYAGWEVIDIRFVYGAVPAGFTPVVAPQITYKVKDQGMDFHREYMWNAAYIAYALIAEDGEPYGTPTADIPYGAAYKPGDGQTNIAKASVKYFDNETYLYQGTKELVNLTKPGAVPMDGDIVAYTIEVQNNMTDETQYWYDILIQDMYSSKLTPLTPALRAELESNNPDFNVAKALENAATLGLYIDASNATDAYAGVGVKNQSEEIDLVKTHMLDKNDKTKTINGETLEEDRPMMVFDLKGALRGKDASETEQPTLYISYLMVYKHDNQGGNIVNKYKGSAYIGDDPYSPIGGGPGTPGEKIRVEFGGGSSREPSRAERIPNISVTKKLTEKVRGIATVTDTVSDFSLLKGDLVTFTVDVTNAAWSSEDIKLHNIVDEIPASLKFVEGQTIEVVHSQLLATANPSTTNNTPQGNGWDRRIVATSTNYISEGTGVGTYSIDTSGNLIVRLPEPISMKIDNVRDVREDAVIQNKVTMTIVCEVVLELPVGEKVSLPETNSAFAMIDWAQGNYTVGAGTPGDDRSTNRDKDTLTNSSVRADATFAVIADANTVADVYKSVSSKDLLLNNVRLEGAGGDDGHTYTVHIYNYSGKDFRVSELSDLLPEYEEIDATKPLTVTAYNNANDAQSGTRTIASSDYTVTRGAERTLIELPSDNIFIVKGVTGGDTTGYNRITITYQTTVKLDLDGDGKTDYDALRELLSTKTDRPKEYEDTNYVAFHAVDVTTGASVALEMPGKVISMGSTKADAIDVHGKEFYQNEVDVTYSMNFPAPVVTIDNQRIPSGNGKINTTSAYMPGEWAALDIKYGNSANFPGTTVAPLKVGAYLVLELPFGLTYDKEVTAKANVAGTNAAIQHNGRYLESLTPNVLTGADGTTYLVWVTKEEIPAGAISNLRIVAKTEDGVFTEYMPRAYVVPNPETDIFFNEDVKASNEYKNKPTYHYEPSNPTIALPDLSEKTSNACDYELVISDTKFNMFGGSGLSSVITITEKADTGNTTNSYEKTNWITVPSPESDFDYVLQVKNGDAVPATHDPKTFTNLVLINRLPSVDDKLVNRDINRTSSVDVRYLRTLEVRDKASNGKVVTDNKLLVLGTDYTIQYYVGSNPATVQFNDNDWNGTANSGRWVEITDLNNLDGLDIEIIRIVMKNYTLEVGHRLEVTYDANFEGYHNIDQRAWNSFGYRATPQGISGFDKPITVEPRQVGVDSYYDIELKIEKTLMMSDYAKHEGEYTFYFDVYALASGTDISDSDNVKWSSVKEKLEPIAITVTEKAKGEYYGEIAINTKTPGFEKMPYGYVYVAVERTDRYAVNGDVKSGAAAFDARFKATFWSYNDAEVQLLRNANFITSYTNVQKPDDVELEITKVVKDVNNLGWGLNPVKDVFIFEITGTDPTGVAPNKVWREMLGTATDIKWSEWAQDPVSGVWTSAIKLTSDKSDKDHYSEHLTPGFKYSVKEIASKESEDKYQFNLNAGQFEQVENSNRWVAKIENVYDKNFVISIRKDLDLKGHGAIKGDETFYFDLRGTVTEAGGTTRNFELEDIAVKPGEVVKLSAEDYPTMTQDMTFTLTEKDTNGVYVKTINDSVYSHNIVFVAKNDLDEREFKLRIRKLLDLPIEYDALDKTFNVTVTAKEIDGNVATLTRDITVSTAGAIGGKWGGEIVITDSDLRGAGVKNPSKATYTITENFGSGMIYVYTVDSEDYVVDTSAGSADSNKNDLNKQFLITNKIFEIELVKILSYPVLLNAPDTTFMLVLEGRDSTGALVHTSNHAITVSPTTGWNWIGSKKLDANFFYDLGIKNPQDLTFTVRENLAYTTSQYEYSYSVDTEYYGYGAAKNYSIRFTVTNSIVDSEDDDFDYSTGGGGGGGRNPFDIPDDQVPLGQMPPAPITILDEEVPLGRLPATGGVATIGGRRGGIAGVLAMMVALIVGLFRSDKKD